MAKLVKPCKEPCDKCGSGDVYRQFRPKGARGDANRDMHDRLRMKGETHPIYLVKEDYILHICRVCSFSWGSDTWQRKQKNETARTQADNNVPLVAGER